MTTFNTLIGRADEETLGHLVGKPAIRLLRLLDPKLARASVLRRVVTDLNEPSTLVRNQNTRSRLLLMLRPDEADRLVSSLALSTDTTNDAYQVLSRLSVRSGTRVERRLFDLLGLASTAPVSARDTSPEATSCLEPSYGLYAHQKDAVFRAKEVLNTYGQRVLLHMPTGSGKTRVAMSLIADHLRQNNSTLVVWLAYSEELCDQAIQEFQAAWSALGDRTITVHRFWGSHNADLSNARDGFVVAGLAKTYELGKRNINSLATLGDRTSLVVLDEAHVATAETYSLVLDVLATKQPGTRMLGLTATPGRTWSDIDADEELASLFNHQKVSLRIEGYASPIDYLISEGYLSRTTYRSLFHSGGYTPTTADLRAVEAALDIPSNIVKAMALDEQRNLVIIGELEELVRSHRRILLFAATVQHACLVGAVLRARGLTARVVTSETPAFERQKIIESFRSDDPEPQILCNFGVLTTGFDAPAVSAALIARPTKSLVLYSQMVGRAIRGPRMGGTEACEVVTVVDRNLPGFGSVAESFLNWEDVWEENR